MDRLDPVRFDLAERERRADLLQPGRELHTRHEPLPVARAGVPRRHGAHPGLDHEHARRRPVQDRRFAPRRPRPESGRSHRRGQRPGHAGLGGRAPTSRSTASRCARLDPGPRAAGSTSAATRSARSNRVTIKNSTSSDAHGRVIALEGGVGHRILDNDISGAGCVGIGGSDGTDWLISGNRVHHNATEGFDVGFESGGVKILDVDGLTVSNNEVDHNSRGVWTDTGVRNATFSNNRLHDNAYNGLFLESSHYLRVTGNEAWGNSWGPNGNVWAWGGGITLASSDHVEVDNNVVAWNADGITVVTQQRTDDAPHVEINVHDNTIAMSPGSDTAAYASGWAMDWAGVLFDPASNNRGSNNHYWYPTVENSQSRYAWNGTNTRLADFEATPAETGGTYLTTSQKDAALSAVGIPTTDVTH